MVFSKITLQPAYRILLLLLFRRLLLNDLRMCACICVSVCVCVILIHIYRDILSMNTYIREYTVHDLMAARE